MNKELEALERLAYAITHDVNAYSQYTQSQPYIDQDKALVEKALKEYEQLKIIEQAETRGFYFKDYQNNNEIMFSGNTFVRVGKHFVQTKPCYEVKEITLYSCYNPLEYPSHSVKVEDAHFWSWKTHLHFEIDDYGKTWSFKKGDLEK